MHRLSRADIARLLPHDGDMVLLDAVLEHDGNTIHCLAHRHHAADNPLRVNGKLPAWCGIEYAAQAMAVHQGLCANEASAPARGFLALAREVILGADDLDALPGELHIRAEKLIAEGGRSLYQFDIAGAGHALLSGRVAVVLQREAA